MGVPSGGFGDPNLSWTPLDSKIGAMGILGSAVISVREAEAGERRRAVMGRQEPGATEGGGWTENLSVTMLVGCLTVGV